MDETAGSPLNPPIEPEGSGKSGAWTPGPWESSFTPWSVGDTRTTYQIWSKCARIALTEQPNVGEVEEKANAELIAAAPELYEALEAIVTGERGPLRPDDLHRQILARYERGKARMENARAALLKANPLRKSNA